MMSNPHWKIPVYDLEIFFYAIFINKKNLK